MADLIAPLEPEEADVWSNLFGEWNGPGDHLDAPDDEQEPG